MQLKMHDDSYAYAVDAYAVLTEYASLSSEWF